MTMAPTVAPTQVTIPAPPTDITRQRTHISTMAGIIPAVILIIAATATIAILMVEVTVETAITTTTMIATGAVHLPAAAGIMTMITIAAAYLHPHLPAAAVIAMTIAAAHRHLHRHPQVEAVTMTSPSTAVLLCSQEAAATIPAGAVVHLHRHAHALQMIVGAEQPRVRRKIKVTAGARSFRFL